MKLLLLSLLGVGVASAQATSFSGGFALPSGQIQCQWSDEGTPPTRPALAYGNTWRTPGLTPNGRITCQSRPSGPRCTNPGGHGFELARAYYRLF